MNTHMTHTITYPARRPLSEGYSDSDDRRDPCHRRRGWAKIRRFARLQMWSEQIFQKLESAVTVQGRHLLRPVRPAKFLSGPYRQITPYTNDSARAEAYLHTTQVLVGMLHPLSCSKSFH